LGSRILLLATTRRLASSRIQIIKGWLSQDGELHEKVYDVAWSGGRKPGADGKLPPSVGNTADVENATWTNTIGAIWS
jgi:hypothetical protein